MVHSPGSSSYDIVFAGGGLANALAAYRLSQYRPELRILVVEAGDRLGGNRTWSFHHGDLTARQRTWTAPFLSRYWFSHDVRFPAFAKSLNLPYYAIRSEKFDKEVSSRLGHVVRRNAHIRDVADDRVALDDGETFFAGAVIDGRGWVASDAVPCGYQKFVGLDVQLEAPHGLSAPMLMDARVAQEDGFRFFYLLPWDERRLLIEDTRYSDTPAVDEKAYESAIRSYAERQGWRIETVLRKERGVLPVPLGGRPASWDGPAAASGTRAGLFHATTSYSFPDAVRFAEDLAHLGHYDRDTLYPWMRERAERHWRSQSFFRFLNRMLFQAAVPDRRFEVLQKFYRHPNPIVARFYAGRLTSVDQLRILTGRPPVRVDRALRCLRETKSPA